MPEYYCQMSLLLGRNITAESKEEAEKKFLEHWTRYSEDMHITVAEISEKEQKNDV